MLLEKLKQYVSRCKLNHLTLQFLKLSASTAVLRNMRETKVIDAKS
jgi:hypothetical protein